MASRWEGHDPFSRQTRGAGYRQRRPSTNKALLAAKIRGGAQAGAVEGGDGHAAAYTAGMGGERSGGMSELLKKSDLEGLTALQARMAMILLRVNGIESAKQFIRDVKKGRAE